MNATAPDRLAAALAGRYTLERELGRGGMATVHLARDLKHDRPVALKVLKPELAAVLGADRFLREIKEARRHWEIFRTTFTNPDPEYVHLIDEAREVVEAAERKAKR